MCTLASWFAKWEQYQHLLPKDISKIKRSSAYNSHSHPENLWSLEAMPQAAVGSGSASKAGISAFLPVTWFSD